MEESSPGKHADTATQQIRDQTDTMAHALSVDAGTTTEQHPVAKYEEYARKKGHAFQDLQPERSF